jgi:hypothetical protein
LFSQNDGLEWANNDYFFVNSELFGGLLSCVLDDWESILLPVLESTDVDPLFVGSGSFIQNLRHVPQVPDVKAKSIVVAIRVISIDNNHIEVLDVLPGSLLRLPPDRCLELPLLDELDHICRHFIRQFDGVRNELIFDFLIKVVSF